MMTMALDWEVVVKIPVTMALDWELVVKIPVTMALDWELVVKIPGHSSYNAIRRRQWLLPNMLVLH
jgi:hypothetical protein